MDGKMGEHPSKSKEVTAKRFVGMLSYFHNMKMFIAVYAAGLFFYGMSVSYTNSNLVSIERRFGLNTKQMGAILAATEAGHIAMALIIAHFAGSRNRPLWICFGTVLMGFSLLLFAGPEVFFPRTTITKTQSKGLCTSQPSLTTFFNATNPEQCTAEQSNEGPIAVMAFAHVLLGIGSTTPMVLGMPYVDDNASPCMLSIYYGIALFGRLTGPLVGFGIGAISNSYYIDFTIPSFAPNDPRWISAWFIGFIVAGVGLLVFGLLIGCFPAALPKRKNVKSPQVEMDETKMTTPAGSARPACSDKASIFAAAGWKSLLIDLKRLFTNVAFLCRTCSMFVDGMIIAGIFNYLPKYYTQQFAITQVMSALYGGLILVIAVIAGLVVGSLVIKKFCLQPRHVGLLLVIPSLILSVGLFIAIGLACEQTEIHGLPPVKNFRSGNEGMLATSPCAVQKGCRCSMQNFDPVCDTLTNTNYYSPCHAGCENIFSPNKSRAKFYQGCTCVDSPVNFIPPENTSLPEKRIVNGLCKKDCTNYLYGLTALLFIAVFFEGVPFAGQIMIQFRVVDVDLKNLCAGVTSLLVAAFGLLPAPVFIGAIVDSSCRLWQTRSCGEKGFCILYDTDEFRWKFFLTGACLKLINVIMDSVVTWKVWKWSFDRSVSQEGAPHS